MMRIRIIFFFSLLQIYSCSSNKKAVITELNKYSDSDTKSIYIEQGHAPIALYRSDIHQLKIKEIEIKGNINTTSLEESLPFTLVTNFDRNGLFKSFSVYFLENNNWYELVYCTMQSSHALQTSGGVGDYFYKIYNYFEDTFENMQLNFYISPKQNSDNYRRLSQLEILPFIGKNGYTHIDHEANNIKGNTLTYSTDYFGGNYGVLKKIKSDTLSVELYEIEDKQLSTPIISKRKINLINKDTTNVQYYYYGDNPLKMYYDESNWDHIDSVDNVITYIQRLYYKDSIHNANRWLGFTDYDFSSYNNQLKRVYYQELDEEEIVNKTFVNQNVTTVSKRDFFINGEPGYEYLLKVYNNREVLVKEGFNDKDGNYIPDQYKLQKEIEVIKTLPDKIIVQLTLTDFWFIQLTE